MKNEGTVHNQLMKMKFIIFIKIIMIMTIITIITTTTTIIKGQMVIFSVHKSQMMSIVYLAVSHWGGQLCL